VDGRTASRVEAWAPWLAGVVLALPVVGFRYPPMGDLAFHEAGVALLRHFGDPRFAPAGLYATNLGEPNQLFHLVAYAVSFACSTDWACKIVVALSTALIPAGAAHLASHLGASRWGAVVVAPVALGWMARWGLVSNLAGLAALLWMLPLLDQAAREPTPKRSLGAMVATGGLFLAHESSMLIYAAAGIIFAVRTPRTARGLGLSLAPVATAAALAGVYAVRSTGLKAPSILAAQAIELPPGERLANLPSSLFSAGPMSLALLLASVAAVGLLAAAAWRGPRDRGLLALGALCLALYFVMPEALSGSTLVHARFLAPAFVLLTLGALPQRSQSPCGAPLVALLPVAMLGVTWHLFVTADRTYRDLDRVLARMDDGAAVAQLDLTPRGPSVVAPVVGAAARALAVHGGRLLFSFTDAPTYPVTMPAERRWDEPVMRMVETPFAFAPAYDLTRFRYVLAWSPVARLDKLVTQAMAPEARLVAHEGSWMLFESNLTLAAVDAPDAPFPEPAPVPLATRVKRLLTAPGGP
jgi:hypothetical protein